MFLLACFFRQLRNILVVDIIAYVLQQFPKKNKQFCISFLDG